MAIRFLFPPSLGRLKAGVRADMLATSLSRILGKPVEVVIASSYEDLERRTLGGEADVVWAPPVLCARAQPEARAILRSVRWGAVLFRAALVGRAGDNLVESGLQGKRAAWVDPMSAAGYLLPTSYLRRRGIDPDTVFLTQRFYGSFRDALMAVVDGYADVSSIFAHGATKVHVRGSLQEILGALAARLAPFAFTEVAPTDGLVITKRLDAADAEALERVILQMPGTGTVSVLLEVCSAQAFVRALPHDFDLMTEGLRIPLRSEVEKDPE